MRVRPTLLPLLMLPLLSFAENVTTPTPSTSSSLPPIDCSYSFAKDLKTIDIDVVKTWAKYAALEMFTFNNTDLTKQLNSLKLCFTEQGWQGFNAAFQKSGNLDAIKSKQLIVKGKINGDVAIEVSKDKQWKASVPMDVVYENKENKINQSLTVTLLITLKPTGGLGILQVIAVPQKTGQADETSGPKTS